MTVQNGDVLKTVMEVSLSAGQIAQNVWYHRADLMSVYGNPTVTDALKTWVEDAYGNIESLMPDDTIQRLCKVSKVEWDIGEGIWKVVEDIGTFVPVMSYTNTDDPLPPQTAPLVTFKTLRPKSVGRKFLFPFTEPNVSAGYLTPGAITALTAFAADAIADIILAPLNSLVLGVIRESADVFLPVYIAIIAGIVYTQRRRVAGVGA